jgi:release factor glutamine methyltransferase
MQKEISWLLKEKYNGVESKNFWKDVERLRAGEPVDYVIGFTEFLGCKIDLSKSPLIPRPETEFWVDNVIAVVKPHDKRSTRCLDLFAGSGCIGVAVLAKTRFLLCDMADSQLNCLEQAKINCELNNVSKKRFRVIESDVFSNIKKKYDYIFANPPYIPTSRKIKIQKSVLKFEPKQALFGGKDGLFYIRKFLKEAGKYLKKDGNPTSPRLRGARIFMEFDPPQKKEIEKLLQKYNYKNYEFHRDQFNRWRWVSAC